MHNQREDKFLRATKHKHYGSETKSSVANKAKTRKGVKVLSILFAVAVAGAAFIIPTTTLAPDVDAYEDSRAASLSVGDIDKFASVITNNCVEVTTAPITEAVVASSVEEKTEAATKKSETKAEEKKSDAEEKETKAKSEEKTEEATEKAESKAETSEKKETVEEEDRDDSADADSYQSDYGYYNGALISIDNADPSYSPSYVSLSTYDREKLERLVMGEAGTMGFYGCALVAQSIRDAMNRSGTSSIDYIISQYQYFGSTAIEPNSDVKEAVSYIFDQNGSAVQHRVICFYIGYSSWHETQTFITELDGVRFFDLNA